MWVKYSSGDSEWGPRMALQVIQAFDPDAETKKQEEAYGPDDVR